MSCPWPAKLKEAFLRRRARQYAKLLRPGSTIIEDTDGPTIADFREYLPAALAELHLCLEPLADGSGHVVRKSGEGWEDEVTQEAPLRSPTARVTCQFCRASIFLCDHEAMWNFPGAHALKPQAWREWGRA